MSDYDKVAIRAEHAVATGAVIDDGTARTIASMWHDPRHPETVAFSSTGMIMDPGEDTLVRGLFDYACDTDTDRTIRVAFDAYVSDRVQGGEVGPVVGWDRVWVGA